MKLSLKYAIEGIFEGFRNHPNFRRQMAILIGVVIAGWWYKISRLEWIAVILAGGLVLAAEMANTAVESTVNLVTGEKHPEAKIAKDAAAGMVLLAAMTAIIVGLLIFGQRIFVLIKSVIGFRLSVIGL